MIISRPSAVKSFCPGFPSEVRESTPAAKSHTKKKLKIQKAGQNRPRRLLPILLLRPVFLVRGISLFIKPH